MPCADLSRRDFLVRAGAAGISSLAAGCEIDDVVMLVDNMRTVARLGILAHTEIAWPDSTRNLVKALAYFRQEGVNAVAIAGGATKDGYKNQFEVLHGAFASVFGRGNRVPLILDEGTHEVNGFRFALSPRRPFEPGETLTFHGSAKRELTNDLLFHDAATRCVYAGSLSGIVPQNGYEYDGRIYNGKETLPAAQGLLVGVYASQIEIRRLDFAQSGPPPGERAPRPVYAEDVAPALVLSRATLAPVTSETPKAPEFWADTRLRAIVGQRNGRRILTLAWPPLLRRYAGARAARYEVGLHVWPKGEAQPHAPIVRRYILPKGFHLSEQRDGGPVSCFFDCAVLDEVRRGHPSLAISVTPVSSLGLRGHPIYEVGLAW